MKEYISFILLMSIACAIASSLAYKRSDKGIRFGLGVVFLCAIISPLLSLLGDAAELLPNFEYDSGDSLYAERAEQAFCTALASGIESEFSLSANEVHVSCKGFSYESVSAERIIVTLGGRGALIDRADVMAYLKGNGFDYCEVIYGFG